MVVGGTVAGSVEALSVGLIASLDACGIRAINSAEPIVAVAHASPCLAHTMCRTVVGARLAVRLDLACQANKTHRAQAVSAVALASITLTALLASLLGTCGPFPPNLAETSGIVTAFAVLAVRTYGLRAVNTAIAHIALALSSDSVAATVA